MNTALHKNKRIMETSLKERLYKLMTEEEKEQPFSFATRVGISSSTFYGIWTKGSTSIHRSTAKKIADATGMNVDWLHKGIGEAHNKSTQLIQLTEANKATEYRQIADSSNINVKLMIEALIIVDDYLTEHKKRIRTDKKAELIASIYDMLCKNPDAGLRIISMLKLAI